MRKAMALLICGLACTAQADDRLATLFTARFEFGQGPLLDGMALSLNAVQYQRDDNRFQPLAGYGYRHSTGVYPSLLGLPLLAAADPAQAAAGDKGSNGRWWIVGGGLAAGAALALSLGSGGKDETPQGCQQTDISLIPIVIDRDSTPCN